MGPNRLTGVKFIRNLMEKHIFWGMEGGTVRNHKFEDRSGSDLGKPTFMGTKLGETCHKTFK